MEAEPALPESGKMRFIPPAVIPPGTGRFLSHRRGECQSTRRNPAQPPRGTATRLILQPFFLKIQRQLAPEFGPRGRCEPYKRNHSVASPATPPRRMEPT